MMISYSILSQAYNTSEIAYMPWVNYWLSETATFPPFSERFGFYSKVTLESEELSFDFLFRPETRS